MPIMKNVHLINVQSWTYLVYATIEEGVKANLSEILRRLKKGRRKKIIFETPPDSSPPRKCIPGCQGTVLVSIY